MKLCFYLRIVWTSYLIRSTRSATLKLNQKWWSFNATVITTHPHHFWTIWLHRSEDDVPFFQYYHTTTPASTYPSLCDPSKNVNFRTNWNLNCHHQRSNQKPYHCEEQKSPTDFTHKSLLSKLNTDDSTALRHLCQERLDRLLWYGCHSTPYEVHIE